MEGGAGAERRGGITIRDARPSEYTTLGALVVDAYDAIGVLEGDEEYIPELRDAERRAREAVLLVAEDAGTGDLLGCVTYVSSHDNPWAETLEPGEGTIRMLAVTPAAQGRGAGTALVRACLERARANGLRAVFLHSLPAMVAAQGIYARLGFVREPSRDWRYAPDGLLLGFRLDL